MNASANRVLAVAVGLLVLLAVVAAIVSAQRSPAAFGAGTPEATVQTYLQAVLDGDAETAAGQLATEVGCTVEDFRRADQPDPQRVVLGRSVVHEATAQVAVELVYGGPLGGDAWSERITFPLVRSGDAWLIDSVAWPYLGCDGRP
ncbi:MAG TPA: hypothetical protein VK045_01100 [Ornithinicoccus sp.]|nr:hypothetical protein [Ornithinicoccus sp.]